MTKIVVDISQTDTPNITSRLVYICTFIANHPCAPNEIDILLGKGAGDINIYYGNQEPVGSTIRIHNAGLCFQSDVRDYSSITTKWISWKELNFPAFYRQGYENDLFTIDVFQTIFFHISRYEEWYYDRNPDVHGTMASSSQFLIKEKAQRIPVVDHLVYYFYDILGLYPKKIETAYRLTHDVDAIQKFPSLYKFLRSAGNIVKYRKNKVISLRRLLTSYTLYLSGKTKDPFDTFDWLIILDCEKLVEKKIYFLCGGKTKYDHFFDIHEPKATAVIELAKSKNYTLGIHPSYDSGALGKIFNAEKELLEQTIHQEVTDSRQHFLRYVIHKTGEILDRAGIKTDSSIGYRDRIGFRAGTGFPYHMYNFNQEKPYDFIEVPLVIMDGAAMEESGWNSEQFIRLILDFLEENKHFTQITFNFHNSFFDPALTESNKLVAFYKSLFCGYVHSE